jgi:hypothetical protein
MYATITLGIHVVHHVVASTSVYLFLDSKYCALYSTYDRQFVGMRTSCCGRYPKHGCATCGFIYSIRQGVDPSYEEPQTAAAP